MWAQQLQLSRTLTNPHSENPCSVTPDQQNTSFTTVLKQPNHMRRAAPPLLLHMNDPKYQIQVTMVPCFLMSLFPPKGISLPSMKDCLQHLAVHPTAYFIIINTVIPCTNGVLYISGLQSCASISISIFQLGKLEIRGKKKPFSKGNEGCGRTGITIQVPRKRHLQCLGWVWVKVHQLNVFMLSKRWEISKGKYFSPFLLQ